MHISCESVNTVVKDFQSVFQGVHVEMSHQRTAVRLAAEMELEPEAVDGGCSQRHIPEADLCINKSFYKIYVMHCTAMTSGWAAMRLVNWNTGSFTLPAMQWHAHKRLFAFLSGNLAPLFLRLQYVLNVFIFRSFVKSLSMPIDSLLTTIFFLETKSLPSIPTKRYESEPDLPKPKLLLPNAGRSNRHCLSIEKTSNRQRRGKLTMSSRLAGWSPRLC